MPRHLEDRIQWDPSEEYACSIVDRAAATMDIDRATYIKACGILMANAFLRDELGLPVGDPMIAELDLKVFNKYLEKGDKS